MKILVDNGHGIETRGKRSPDGRLREYAYTRLLAADVVASLTAAGIAAELLTPEISDIPLSERVARADRAHRATEGGVVLLSLHCDAAGDGTSWRAARGWSVFVSRGASDMSRRLAAALAAEAEKQGLRVRRPMPAQSYWERNLYLCRRTACPAVLVENLFQDNREDVAFMLSERGRRTLAAVVVEGIRNFIQ